jgi:preprotein translocase subunit SecY
MERATIFALGIMPYVTASIIIQLMGMVYKPIEEMKKDGEGGRRKIEQYTRYGTILVAVFQAFGILRILEGLATQEGAGIVVGNDSWSWQLLAILTLTTGTAFLMWIGERITENGVGNGISMLIFAGIVTGVPGTVASYIQTNEGNFQPLAVAGVLFFFLVLISVICFFESARRQIPIVYARRQVGRRIYGASQAHLPLKVNMSGTIPPIFASSLLQFPATMAAFGMPGADRFNALVSGGGWAFNTFYALLIIFFCFFYTNIQFQPVDVAENLKKQQANIPGIRPGKQTADYLYAVVQRLTTGGAGYIAAVCVAPGIAAEIFRIPALMFVGTSVIIVVGVALDTVNQIESQMISRNYEGLTGPRAGKLSGRRTVEA